MRLRSSSQPCAVRTKRENNHNGKVATTLPILAAVLPRDFTLNFRNASQSSRSGSSAEIRISILGPQSSILAALACELGDDAEGGAFAVGYGIYYFAASVGAVAAGEEFGVAGLAGGGGR